MLVKLYNAIVAAVKAYPAIGAWVFGLAATIAAHFGFHLSPDQLMTFGAVIFGFLATIVHNVTVPKNTLSGK